ncbi:MAG: acetate/propionate family kinase [Gemmatimonadota bacterium]|nr:acetate/propionate family kinase [Gemmatimonadota bacterium]
MTSTRVLALNAGSSSVKASLFELDRPGAEGEAPNGLCWEDETENGAQLLERLLSPLWSGPRAMLTGPEAIDVIGHRVVFGGALLTETTRITPPVRATIARVAEYAPAHNAAALALMDAATRLFGECAQVAVFDTAFHQTMAPAAFTYPGPSAWVEQGIRRFGFHGINHQYVAHRAARLLERGQDGFRVVTCHLGSGCSLAAVRDGRSVDTTMGFTPLDGLPMARRSGSIDPGILIHLLRHGGYTTDTLDHLLNHDSGLAGLSGTDGDMRTVLAGVDDGDERARLALGVFVHRVRQGIAAMAGSMGGVDALVFTGGVGEHAPRVREQVCHQLRFLGAMIDPAVNATCDGEANVSAVDARIAVLVIPAQENWMVARESIRIVARREPHESITHL